MEPPPPKETISASTTSPPELGSSVTPSTTDGVTELPNSGGEVVEAEIVSFGGGGSMPTAAELGLALPDDPHEATALLLRELGEARAESGELLENLQRVAADYENYR